MTSPRNRGGRFRTGARLPSILVAAGLLLLVGPLVWTGAPQVRAFDASATADTDAGADADDTAAPSDAPTAGPALDAAGSPPARAATDRARPPAVATRSARLADQPAEAAAPVRLRSGAVGLDAPVDAVGVVPDTGEMEVPDDVGRVGWYRHGAAPGSPSGTAVLAGHVDSRSQGLGAFALLADLEPGDEITVELADGTTLAYAVVSRRQLDKAALPTDELFTAGGRARVALVTCGGRFDRSRGAYEDNVVVIAEPRSSG